VADLRKLDTFSFGGYPENRTRYQGLRGMREAYGLTNAEFRPVQIGGQYRALDSGRVDVVNVLTTDGRLERGRYVVLEDTKGIFGFQNVAPLVKRAVLARQGPEFARTLDAVSAKLTDRAMQAMNAAVDIDRRKPADVAREFLRVHRLG
jgi:osmoprotectant transport system substrate-binding protein